MLIFSFLIPLVGLILSIIGLKKAKKNNTNDGLALAGLIISIFALLLRLLLIGLVALLIFNTNPSDNIITNAVDNMCSKAQKCENLFGDLYTCSYKDKSIEYTITCDKDRIPSDIIEHNKEERKEEEHSTNEIERLSLLYYEYKNNEKAVKAISTKNGNNVEVKLYTSESDLNKTSAIYTIDIESLIGHDANGEYVDLTEANIDDNL